MRFGEKLTDWMQSSGVSEPGLADRVGCSQGSVRNWITGRARPSVDQIPLIARALGKRDNDVLAAVLEREPASRSCG